MTSFIHFLLILCTFTAVAGIIIGYALRRRMQFSDWMLLGVAIACAGLDIVNLMQMRGWASAIQATHFTLVLQGLLTSLLLSFSISFARPYSRETLATMQIIVLACCVLGVFIAALAPKGLLFFVDNAHQPSMPFLHGLGFYFQALYLLAAIMAMYNLEVTLASASLGVRWRIKFTVLGAFSILVSLLVVFSQSVLYKTLDPAFAPVRTTGTLLGLLLAGYSNFFRAAEARVVISQRLVYKSFVLLAGGVFLLFLALTAYIAKVYDLSLNRTFIWSSLLVGGILLAAFLLSHGVRRKVLLFLKNHFYKDKYDYRVQWLEFTRRLSSSQTGEPFYKAALTGFCETLGFGAACLLLRDRIDEDFHGVACIELDRELPCLPAGGSLPNLLTTHQRPTDLAPLYDSLSQEEQAALTAMQARFAAPLLLEDDIIGIIILCRPIVKEEVYDEEDIDLMDAFARQTTLAILNIRFTEQLATIREAEIMGRISTFIVHDLKNLVYTLSLTVENARNYMHDPEFQQDMLRSLSNITNKMQKLISQLRPVPSAEELQSQSLDLTALAREVAADIDPHRIRITGPSVQALVDRESMRKVLMNLLLNALEASGEDDEVEMEVGANGSPFIRVCDKGCGMEERFIRVKLFQPFSTTKNNGMGIGLYQSQQIIEAHGGDIEVRSTPGEGSVFTVRLPARALASV